MLQENEPTGAEIFSFPAVLEIVGINPFVQVPDPVLAAIFKQAGKNKGPVSVFGTVNGLAYSQTLVRFRGIWRLYINTKMLTDSPRRIGERIEVTIAFNPMVAEVIAPKPFTDALENDPEAKAVFDGLSPHLKKEINRYLAHLKTAESLNRNIARALNFLKGKERFVGRTLPHSG